LSLKTIAGALGLALILILLPATLAGADFRGTDMWGNLAPSSSGRVSAYPISYYQLDYYVDGPSVGLGGISAGDPVDKVIQVFAAFLFMIATFAMRTVIAIFDWAFNVDIIGGRHGVIGPVGSATKHLYTSTFVPLLATVVLIFGAWFTAKVLSRRFGEAGVGFLRVVCLAAAALVIILNPISTIGKAASLSNDLAGGVASGTTGANGGHDVSDRLFDTFIYKPWAVLEFGGLKRCVSSAEDSDGFPKPVATDASNISTCRDVFRQSNGYGGYATKFLSYPPGSEKRKSVFKAIEDGQAPSDPHIPGWRVDKADAPAVDMMQGGGAVQRLAYVCLLTLGIISAILLLGLMCFGALFASLGLMVLLALAPVMLIVAMIPPLHGVFWSWASWIGKFLIAKVVYALVLSAAIGVSAGLIAVGGSNGYLFAFGAQAILFIGIFIFRKKLSAIITSKREYHKSEQSGKAFITGAAATAVGVVSAPVAAAGAAKEWGKQQRVSRQQHASDPQTSSPDASSDDSGAYKPGTGQKVADSSSPPASAGREYSPAPPLGTPDGDATAYWNEHGLEPSYLPSAKESQTGVYDTVAPERGDDPVSTRSFQEEYEQARVDREPQPYGEQRKAPAVDPLTHDKPPRHDPARTMPLAEQLEQERAKAPSQ
jgi:hypothetical protein